MGRGFKISGFHRGKEINLVETQLGAFVLDLRFTLATPVM